MIYARYIILIMTHLKTDDVHLLHSDIPQWILTYILSFVPKKEGAKNVTACVSRLWYMATRPVVWCSNNAHTRFECGCHGTIETSTQNYPHAEPHHRVHLTDNMTITCRACFFHRIHDDDDTGRSVCDVKYIQNTDQELHDINCDDKCTAFDPGFTRPYFPLRRFQMLLGFEKTRAEIMNRSLCSCNIRFIEQLIVRGGISLHRDFFDQRHHFLDENPQILECVSDCIIELSKEGCDSFKIAIRNSSLSSQACVLKQLAVKEGTDFTQKFCIQYCKEPLRKLFLDESLEERKVIVKNPLESLSVGRRASKRQNAEGAWEKTYPRKKR